MKTLNPGLATVSPFQRILSQMDWLMLGSTIGLSGVGVLMIYSAIQSNPDLLLSALHWKQALWSTMGLIALAFILLVDYHYYTRFAYLFYGAVILMLILVFIMGRVVYGAKRWLVFGPIRIQPSELAKLAVILVFARYFGTRESNEPLRFRDLFVPLILVLIPVGLVAKQPDLGTSMTILMIASVMVLIVGVQRRVLIYVTSATQADVT